MKTAKEWNKEYHADRQLPLSQRKLVHRDGSLTRAIQLDAMKEGMRRAALIKTDKVIKHNNDLRDAILAAAEQLTEKDL